MRVFKSVIIIVVVAGWGCTLSPKCALGRPSAVVLWVKRIHNYRLRTLNLTATKGTSCSLTFWLLQHRPKGRWLEHAEMREGLFLCLICLNKRALQQRVHLLPGLSYDTWTTHTNPLAYTHSCTCQAVRQEVHMRWPQGSIFTSLSFSAQILQSWKVEPISQYSSYCSCGEKKKKNMTRR